MRIREATTAATLASSRDDDAGEERVEGWFACPSPGLPARVFKNPIRIVLTQQWRWRVNGLSSSET